jgi:hypothetical protein
MIHGPRYLPSIEIPIARMFRKITGRKMTEAERSCFRIRPRRPLTDIQARAKVRHSRHVKNVTEDDRAKNYKRSVGRRGAELIQWRRDI